MPRIRFLSLRKPADVAGRTSLEDAAEIVQHLKGLRNLAVLEFCGFQPDDDNDEEARQADHERDCSILQSWRAACGTLFRVHLHANQWEFRGLG